jgi:hypothetical protein
MLWLASVRQSFSVRSRAFRRRRQVRHIGTSTSCLLEVGYAIYTLRTVARYLRARFADIRGTRRDAHGVLRGRVRCHSRR